MAEFQFLGSLSFGLFFRKVIVRPIIPPPPDEAAGAASAVPGCRAAAKQQRTAALQCAFLWCWEQSVTVDGHASARAIGYMYMSMYVRTA